MQKNATDIYFQRKFRKRAFWGSIYLFLLLNSFLFLKAIINKSELIPYHVLVVNIVGILVFFFGTYFFLKFVRLIRLKLVALSDGILRRKGIKLQTKYEKCPKCEYEFDTPSTECPKCNIVIEKYLKIEDSGKEKKREKVWKKPILVASLSVLIFTTFSISKIWINKGVTQKKVVPSVSYTTKDDPSVSNTPYGGALTEFINSSIKIKNACSRDIKKADKVIKVCDNALMMTDNSRTIHYILKCKGDFQLSSNFNNMVINSINKFISECKRSKKMKVTEFKSLMAKRTAEIIYYQEKASEARTSGYLNIEKFGPMLTADIERVYK